jgi:hypothetical protein
MNQGERDELLAAIRLVQLREAGKSLPLLGEIKSVCYGVREYSAAPASVVITNHSLSDQSLSLLATKMGIKKGGRNDKADVYVNGKGVSIKSMRNAPPALVNHTARPGWVRICEEIDHDIRPLDAIIDRYWQLRQKEKIKEDIANSDSASPFRENLKYLKPLLSYFLFRGTGSSESLSPADYLLDFTDPLSESTWRIFSPEGIVDLIWPKLVFSVRSKKGMPPTYPHMSDQEKQKSIARWTKFHQNEYRGALHVRVK